LQVAKPCRARFELICPLGAHFQARDDRGHISVELALRDGDQRPGGKPIRMVAHSRPLSGRACRQLGIAVYAVLQDCGPLIGDSGSRRFPTPGHRELARQVSRFGIGADCFDRALDPPVQLFYAGRAPKVEIAIGDVDFGMALVLGQCCIRDKSGEKSRWDHHFQHGEVSFFRRDRQRLFDAVPPETPTKRWT